MSIGIPKTASEYTVRNRIKLIHGGREYFDLLLKLIGKAKKVIHLQSYIYDDDETGKQVAEALIQAVKRGVGVYLHVDGYASQIISKKFIAELKESGVNFKWFEPLFKSRHFYFGRRMHHKSVVADGIYSLIGGINICNRYNDIPGKPAWLDMALYCEGEASFIVHSICRTMWGKKIPELISLKSIEEFCNAIPENEFHSVRIRQNDWVKRKTEIWKSYFDMFNHAEKQITIMCSYFLPGREFRKLLGKANKKGVKITVILAGPSDVMIAKHAERYLYDWMLENNIEIYEYQETVLHAKIAVSDNHWVTVGSYNVNNISAHASLEMNMDVRNKAFAKEVENELEKILNDHCTRITKENYTSDTNFLRRLWQRFCYGFINNILNLFTFYFKQEE